MLGLLVTENDLAPLGAYCFLCDGDCSWKVQLTQKRQDGLVRHVSNLRVYKDFYVVIYLTSAKEVMLQTTVIIFR